VHALCFPGEAPEETDDDGAGGETNGNFWDRVTLCHDEDDVLWFLLFRDDCCNEKDGEGAGEDEGEGGGGGEGGATPCLVGFAAAVRYAKSVYGMHLAVVPAQRGRGYGAWLMHEVGRATSSS
jgi:GNAT superfamily N-acetyltransferase